MIMENREIKFRAWDRFKKEMFEVYNLKGDSATGALCYLDLGIKKIPTSIQNVILMQFTGLKDKKKKEIYEGDILYWEGFADDEYWTKYKVIIPNIFYTMEYISNFKTNKVTEIIGNIYENPELIRQPNEA